ncbi:ferredoxin [Sphingosinicella microcystinivorans]|uniref:ferredoxin n=1 Tax=Sphingosinicella microcystinivorans TaxID=335406 RepID=UPI0022F3B9F8|nr:ferredoxin [Sphingosinicella microcystinivorans]WBX82775.1 ferredoxin [Sphingosinicella microcystinivorans]
MKIKVHHGMCQGHARCYSLAPDIFQLDDSGYILPGDIAVPAGQETLAQRGARSCPERALEVAED